MAWKEPKIGVARQYLGNNAKAKTIFEDHVKALKMPVHNWWR